MRLVKLTAVMSLVSLVVVAEPGALAPCPVPDGTCFGEVAFSTGERYLGEMVKYKMQGPGAMFLPDGGVKQTGSWADGKLSSSGYVDFAAYERAYPKFKTQLSQASRVLDSWRDREIVRAALEREAGKGVWSERVSNAVAKAAREWLEGPPNGAGEEIPPPTPPAAPQLKRESWESNKEFDARVAATKAEQKKESAKLEADYKARVAERNAVLKQSAAQKAQRAKRLKQVTREYAQYALSAVTLRATQHAARFDPDHGVLIVDVSFDDGEVVSYEFRGASPDLRKAALSSATAVAYKPEFSISDAGKVGIKAVRAEAEKSSAVGVPAKH